ncbi:reverse transcriptase domain-containing protein [Tanacetum coccineum]|uniref:Reverse transcriptase domain-containing protein n=1 Tax=Tanacetum coccineum TaxID=301880 RepID=A0ABQ4YJ39_9ASTR
MPRECLKIIESKSKVRQPRNKAVVAKMSTSSSTQAVSSDVAELKDMVRALILDRKNQTPASAPVKAVEESCVTCGGAHSYQSCPATDGNVYHDNIQAYVSQAAAANFNQGIQLSRTSMVAKPPNSTSRLESMLGNFIKMNTASTSGSGTLPGNTVTNPKEDLKGITTRSGVTIQGDRKAVGTMTTSEPPPPLPNQETISVELGRTQLYLKDVEKAVPSEGTTKPSVQVRGSVNQNPRRYQEGVEKSLTLGLIYPSHDSTLGEHGMATDLRNWRHILGQRKNKHFQPIHYASKTMNEAQTHYTTTEKELLAVVYAFEKFRSYLVMSKSIVYTDHVFASKLYLCQKMLPERLMRWKVYYIAIDFDIEIPRQEREYENLAADHLSRLVNPASRQIGTKEINEAFLRNSWIYFS